MGKFRHPAVVTQRWSPTWLPERMSASNEWSSFAGVLHLSLFHNSSCSFFLSPVFHSHSWQMWIWARHNFTNASMKAPGSAGNIFSVCFTRLLCKETHTCTLQTQEVIIHTLHLIPLWGVRANSSFCFRDITVETISLRASPRLRTFFLSLPAWCCRRTVWCNDTKVSQF